MIESFTNTVTRDEAQLQRLLQAAEDHRKRVSTFNKDAPAPCDVTVATPPPLCRPKLLSDCEPHAEANKVAYCPYMYTTYKLSPPMLYFVWKVKNIYLFWTLEYHIRLLWAQM